MNGHIAFNEPGSTVDSRTRLVSLSEETIKGIFQLSVPWSISSLSILTFFFIPLDLAFLIDYLPLSSQ